MQLASMKWTQVKDLCFSNLIALVPLGSIEQHSRHLPLSVDTDVITELAQHVEKERSDRVVLLPTLWLGHSPHHRFFACLSLEPQNLYGCHHRPVRFSGSSGFPKNSLLEWPRGQRDRREGCPPRSEE